MSDLNFKTHASLRSESFLTKATLLAKTVDYKFRLGAVIVKNGVTLGSGVNMITDHPNFKMLPKNQKAIHAEVAAIKACGKANLNGATIYVARVTADGAQAMSKPCAACQEELKRRGIKKVYYTIESEMTL